jgi:fructosamine-3-kinase
MVRGSASPVSWEKLGRGLASIHQEQHINFGWESDNYIGSLVQVNTTYSDWHSFYTECRIMPLVKQLVDKGFFSDNDLNCALEWCSKLKDLFPAEPPSLLHGDLWSGNYMITAQADVAIFDPAVYYGHREMDLGMTLLFGGFDQRFYTAYNEAYPLQPGWQQRIAATQLYPLLVHAVLFGGHYVDNVRSELITKSF